MLFAVPPPVDLATINNYSFQDTPNKNGDVAIVELLPASIADTTDQIRVNKEGKVIKFSVSKEGQVSLQDKSNEINTGLTDIAEVFGNSDLSAFSAEELGEIAGNLFVETFKDKEAVDMMESAFKIQKEAFSTHLESLSMAQKNPQIVHQNYFVHHYEDEEDEKESTLFKPLGANTKSMYKVRGLFQKVGEDGTYAKDIVINSMLSSRQLSQLFHDNEKADAFEKALKKSFSKNTEALRNFNRLEKMNQESNKIMGQTIRMEIELMICEDLNACEQFAKNPKNGISIGKIHQSIKDFNTEYSAACKNANLPDSIDSISKLDDNLKRKFNNQYMDIMDNLWTVGFHKQNLQKKLELDQMYVSSTDKLTNGLPVRNADKILKAYHVMEAAEATVIRDAGVFREEVVRSFSKDFNYNDSVVIAPGLSKEKLQELKEVMEQITNGGLKNAQRPMEIKEVTKEASSLKNDFTSLQLQATQWNPIPNEKIEAKTLELSAHAQDITKQLTRSKVYSRTVKQQERQMNRQRSMP